MAILENSRDAAAASFGDEELRAARQLLTAFNGAFKKRSLYSGSHALYQGALAALKVAIDGFCHKFGELHFELERACIRCQGRVVSEGDLERGQLWHVLHRDGVLWIHFSSPELWELETLLNTAHKYLNPGDDAEDDTVTALWEFEMPSIQYNAADLELSQSDLIDFDALPCYDPGEQSGQQESEAADKGRGTDERPQLCGENMPSLNESGLWILTSEESRELRRMIAEKEIMDGTGYVIDVLLAILEKQLQPLDEFENLLETLGQELSRMLSQNRFTCFYRSLSRLGEHFQLCRSQNHWSVPALKHFFESLAGQPFLEGLVQPSVCLESCTPEEMNDLKRALLLLGAPVVPALGRLLEESESAGMRNLLLDCIGSIAKQDCKPLEMLLTSSGESALILIIPLLASLDCPSFHRMLSSLLRHTSEAVRRMALQTILGRDNGSLRDIFKLIDDPDKSIRALVLDHMGQQRSPAAETMLLDYLNRKQFRFKDPDILYSICRTLGKCGSERSIAFFKQHLTRLPLPAFFGSKRGMRRRAALIALKEMQTESAVALVKKSTGGIVGRFFGDDG